MEFWLQSPPALLAAASAVVGVITFLITRRFGPAIAFAVWAAIIIGGSVLIHSWYVRATHCNSLFVPAWGAFAAASGAAVGITRGREREPRNVLLVALQAGLLGLFPAMFFLIMLWPCS